MRKIVPLLGALLSLNLFSATLFSGSPDGVAEPYLAQARETLQAISANTEPPGLEHTGNCMTIILNNKKNLNVLGAGSVKLKLKTVPTRIRPAFSGVDVHTGRAAFSTVNGFNFSRIFHDDGLWPISTGNILVDDGIADGQAAPGNGEDGQPIDESAGEIYDVDGNSHYPRAVLRALGSRCYIFLPVYLFPTLPTGLSALQEPTPEAPALSRFFWVDSPAVLGKTIFWSPKIGTGDTLIEPRFLFGSDRNSASAKLQQLANEFDSVIYPRITENFGTPPDVDRDPRIYLLVDDIRDGRGNFRGYFHSVDQQPTSLNGFSNAKELLYIDAFPSLSLLFSSTLGTIAHEFTHLVHYNENGSKSEERWVDEGFADLGRNIYNGGETTNVDAFIRNPDTSLVSNDDEEFFGSNIFAHYGNGYLFALYLVEKYGQGNPSAFIRKIVNDDAQGVAGINNALNDQNVKFEDIFNDWVIANHLNRTKRIDGTLLNNGLWGYNYDNDYDATNDIGTEEHLPVKTSESRIVGETNPFIVSSPVTDTAADYIQINGSPGDLNISFDGDDGKSWSFAVIKKSDSVDPTVEWMTLDAGKKSGQMTVKNFGTGNTYKELIMVPVNHSISGNSNTGTQPTPQSDGTRGQSGSYPVGQPEPLSSLGSLKSSISRKISAALSPTGHYVISGSFNNIVTAVWPNPVHENELLIAIKSKTGFVQAPTAVITYGGIQKQLVLSGISNEIYLSHFTISDSGEGVISATGEDGSGLLLKNKTSFSATHMADRLTPINLRSSYKKSDSDMVSATLGSANDRPENIIKGSLKSSPPSADLRPRLLSVESRSNCRLLYLGFQSNKTMDSRTVECRWNGKPIDAINVGGNRFKVYPGSRRKDGLNILEFRFLRDGVMTEWASREFRVSLNKED